MDSKDIILVKIEAFHEELINQCNKAGISGNIQTVFQFGDEDVFPHMNNSKFLKYGIRIQQEER